jgi:hypothetical protein
MKVVEELVISKLIILQLPASSALNRLINTMI